MKLSSFLRLSSKTTNPQANPSVVYNLYSLPSFDEGRKCEVLHGSEIQSNKFVVPDKCILFNKLNVRFKRIWRINNNDPNKIASTEFLPLVVDESIVDFHYCYYLLRSDQITDYLTGQNTNTSGSHKRIDPENFFDIEVSLPPLDEQKRIGEVLSNLDKKIDVNTEINHYLEAMAKQLYDYWFVQFDFPDANGNPYKSSGGKMVWNDNLNRFVPDGWVDVLFKNICNVKRGASPRPIDEFMDESHSGIPWVKISDATSSESPFLTIVKEHIIREGGKKSVAVTPGTLIVSNSASPGIPKFIEIDACVHDGWLILSGYKEYYRYYFYYVIHMIRYNLLHMASGSIFKNLKTDYLKEYCCLNPVDSILQMYDDTIHPIMQKILQTQRENESLTQERDLLLSMLMTGQISIKQLNNDLPATFIIIRKTSQYEE